MVLMRPSLSDFRQTSGVPGGVSAKCPFTSGLRPARTTTFVSQALAAIKKDAAKLGIKLVREFASVPKPA